MSKLRSISTFFVLFLYLAGVGVQAGHALLAHSEPHPICHAKNEKHLHGAEYHFDLCDLCSFFIGNQEPTASLPTAKQIIFSLEKPLLVLVENAPLAETRFSFPKRGPPAIS